MKKIIFCLLVLMSSAAAAQLPIPQTRFRKAPLSIIEQYVEANDAEAQLELALRYYAGHQVPADVDRSFRLMILSAEQNNRDAMYLLSRMVADGIGTHADPQKAEALFIDALVAHPNDTHLKKHFEKKVAALEQATGTAEPFLKKCSDAGYAPATLALYVESADELYLSGQVEQALPLLEKLSETGHAQSTFRLAELYIEGPGDVPKDAVRARGLYGQLAEQGDATAQYKLAVMCDQGIGGAADPDKAEMLYKLAAQRGNVSAQQRLEELESERFPYVFRPLKELYPKSKARQQILSVKEKSGQRQTITGEDALGVLVTYARPTASQATGFSGFILTGVELTSRKTGETYWFSNAYIDNGPTYEHASRSEVEMFVDQEFDSNASITRWAVVYGHLLPDGRTVAVFDTEEWRTESFTELFEKNRDAQILSCRVMAKILPQDGANGGDSSGSGEEAGSGTGILDTIGNVLDIFYPLN